MSAAQDLAAMLIYPVGWMLIHTVWQAALAAGVLAITLRLVPAGRSSLRYVLSCIALGTVALAAIETVILQKPDSLALEARAPVVGGSIGNRQSTIGNPLAPQPSPPPEYQGREVQRTLGVSEFALPWIVAPWVVGVFGLSAWQFGGWVLLRRYRTSARPAEPAWQDALLRLARAMGVSKVAMALTDRLDVPIVIGAFRPIILVPISMLSGLSSEQVEAILAHELAHVKRHDYLVNLIQTAIETMLFYHPAVWWISRQIRREREYCCDELAAAACGNRTLYARALATLEESRGMNRLLALAAAGSGRAELLRRIQRLLGESADMPRTIERRTPTWAAGAVLLGACLIISASSRWLVAQNQPPMPSNPTTAPTPSPAEWRFSPGSNGPEPWLAISNWNPSTRAGEASAITPEDFVAAKGDYLIGPNDLVQVSIADLVAQGQETYKTIRVSQGGSISLPMVDSIRAGGLTEAQLEQEINKAYRDKQLVVNARASVTVIEARNRIFSVMGAVGAPGQYQILDANFRLFDALVLARGATRDANVRIIRAIEGKDAPRIIEIPGPAVTAGDPKVNIVVRPKDYIVVTDAFGAAPPAGTAPAARDQELQRAMDINVASQETAWKSLQQRAEGGEALTPAFVQLQLDSAKRIYDAKLAAYSDRAAQVAAAEEYLQRCTNLGKVLNLRIGQDVTRVQISQADAMTAQAQIEVARLKAAPPAQALPVGAQPAQAPSPVPLRIVVAQGRILRDGRPTDWAQVRRSLQSAPEAMRSRFYIELAAATKDLAVNELFNAQAEAQKLVDEFKLGNVSLTGVDPDNGNPPKEYYVGGYVRRTGVYSIAGRQITLKQAIVSAGMPEDVKDLKDLADHSYYVTVTRRWPDNTETFLPKVSLKELFDGTAPDIALQAQDIIMVGSDKPATAPSTRP